METLKKLMVIKLIRELEFVESELNYVSEMIKEIDYDFKKEVENILNSRQELKKFFTQSVDNLKLEENKVLNNNYENNDLIQDEVVIENSQKVKSLYRLIVKKTHPDKFNNDSLKELYLEATNAYENKNLLQIFSICDKLKIPYELTDSEFNYIKEQIESIKKRKTFLESTYTWQWYDKKNIQEKNKVIINFIKAQIF